jgi:hypothetical protein
VRRSLGAVQHERSEVMHCRPGVHIYVCCPWTPGLQRTPLTRRSAAPGERDQYVFAPTCGTWPRASRTAAEAAFAISRASLSSVQK